MKVLFFGTSFFACQSLGMISSLHDVVACVTRPNRPAGRGRKSAPSPVRVMCEKLKIKALQPNTSEQIEEAVSSIEADAFAVVDYGLILRRSVLEKPPLGCFNVHGSLLPKYRGAAPIHWAIIRGEEKTGVTVIRITEGLDAGPIIAQTETEIRPGETAGELHDRLSNIGAALLASVLDDVASGKIVETPQNEEEATLAPRLTKESGRIDWNMPPGQLVDFIRGMTTWPGAYTSLATDRGPFRMTILRAKRTADAPPPNTQPGTVVSAYGEGIETACKDGSVLITRLKPAGKREMTSADFLRGHEVKPGQLFA